MMSFLPDFCRFFAFFFPSPTRLFTPRVHRRRPAAVLLPSTSLLAPTFDFPRRANARSCQWRGRSAAVSPVPTATRPPEILNKRRGTVQICPGYRCNPPNDVQDLSARLLNDKGGPPPPRHLPVLAVKALLGKIERRETLLISALCILAIAVLNRSRGSTGQSRYFCALKRG